MSGNPIGPKQRTVVPDSQDDEELSLSQLSTQDEADDLEEADDWEVADDLEEADASGYQSADNSDDDDPIIAQNTQVQSEAELDADEEETDTDEDDEEDAVKTAAITQTVTQAINSIQPTTATTGALVPAALADVRQSRYVKGLQKGYCDFLKLVYDEEVNRSSILNRVKREHFINVGWQILAGMMTPILMAVIRGDLAEKAAMQDPDIMAVLKLYQDPHVLEHLPCIYQMIFANTDGHGPTVGEWNEILEAMEVYISNTNLTPRLNMIAAIDLVYFEGCAAIHARAGIRNLLQNNDRKEVLVRRNYIRGFIKAVRKQISKVERMSHLTPQQQQEYRLKPKTYVGYTHSAQERWAEHDEDPHNVLFALVTAVSQVKFGEDAYGLKKFIVVLIAEEIEAAFAELIVAAIADCYYNTGNGFNIADAGGSVASFGKLTAKRVDLISVWRNKHSPFHANQVAQTKLLERRMELSQEIDRLRAEAAEITRQREALKEEKRKRMLAADTALYESLADHMAQYARILREDAARRQ
ncbi:hypothetical protein Vi05172_g143 [Venturia inaequalis]|nr:hypothetical protein Vi05172_g143 [Venturia inaequalis]